MPESTTMDSTLWNDLWQTYKQSKAYALCCSKYANKMRKRERIIDWSIIIIPFVGASLFSVSNYCTLGASILTGLIGLFEKTAHLWVQPESDLCKLDSLQKKFEVIVTEIEDTIHAFSLESETNDISVKRFLLSKKKQIAELQIQMDKLVRKTPNEDELNDMAEKYIRSKFNYNLN